MTTKNKEPEFDVFISYRVASDSDHARILYEKLINANLKVWWDVKLLEFGKVNYLYYLYINIYNYNL